MIHIKESYVECEKCKKHDEAYTIPKEIKYWTQLGDHQYWKPYAWDWFEGYLYCDKCLKPVRELLGLQL